MATIKQLKDHDTNENIYPLTHIDAVRDSNNNTVLELLDEKLDELTFDTTPTSDSSNPVTSGGIYNALSTKLNKLTFDLTPTANSDNPVVSKGIKSALDTKVSKVTSTDNAIVRFDGTTGDVQNSGATVDDNGSLITPGNVSVAGNIAVNKIYGDKRHVYNVCNIVHGSAQKKHFAVYTNIVFPAANMVVITMKGFNYAYYDFESKLTFYMYQGEFYIPRVQNLGAYDPTVYLFSYNDNGTNRVAFGLESTNFYFFGCQIDVHFPSVLSDTGIPLPKTQWTFASDNITYTDDTPEEDRIIPSVGVNHCVKVTKNKLAVTTTGNVPLVTSTDNAITRFDGTTGSIQNSGVTIDDSNNISTGGNISVKDIVVHGSNNTNNTRVISSDSATNIYVDINGNTPLVVDASSTPVVRPSISSSGRVNLGNTTSHWNEVRANKFVVDGGTSAQFLKADGSVDNNSYALASQVITTTNASVTLDANTIYDLGTVTSDKTINLPSTVDLAAEYEFRLIYTSGTISGTAISNTTVANNLTLTFTTGKSYQVIISGGILYYSETTVS